ncbi:MAG: hypothetical protein LBQ94_02935 [Treponema sp.]|jgi:hypothetical protein|nr:hypothetical protein [Treponema sp.]
MKNQLFLLPLFAFLFFPLHAQEVFDFTIPDPPYPPGPTLAPEEPEEIPRQFRELFLGQTMDALQSALTRDGLFRFRGERDVSFLPVRDETLVETTGLSFVRRAYFQLNEGAVYIMSFTLDTRLMDHYSVFTSFVRKYGEPVSLSPQEAVWESDDTRVSIERPLTVKYIDKTVFDRLIEEAGDLERRDIFAREEFLADF